jgi:hypothetical protein
VKREVRLRRLDAPYKVVDAITKFQVGCVKRSSAQTHRTRINGPTDAGSVGHVGEAASDADLRFPSP